jgi:hypothetical protein
MFFMLIFTPPEAGAVASDPVEVDEADEPDDDESSDPQPPTARAPTAARATRKGFMGIVTGP